VSDRKIDDLEHVVGSTERLDNRILRGSAWVAASYGSRNAITLFTTLALARLLEPKAFGLVALAWTFLMVYDQIQNAGTAAALVYRRDDVERTAASAQVFSLISSVVLYGVVFALAPVFAAAFNAPALTNVLRVLALLLILKAIGLAPLAILERNIDFRRRAKCEVSGAFAQGATSLALAFAGWGVWSLVIGQLVGAAVQSALGWIVVPWRPNLRLASFEVVRELIRYGRFVSATNVLNLANNTLDNVVVGRLLGTGALGFYSVAFRLADFPNTVIAHIVGRVMFPVYTLLRTDIDRLRRAYIQNLQRIALFALPASVILLVAARPIVEGLLGSKWDPSIGPLRILALYGLVKSFTAPSGELVKGVGKPHLGLYFALLQVAVALPALVLLVPSRGISGAALGMFLGLAVSGTVRLVVALNLVEASARELMRSLGPSSLCAALLALTLALLLPAANALGPAAGLAVLVSAGGLVYVAATLTFARSIVAPMWGRLRHADVRVVVP
jgi:lipopolysaccharide exporter